MKKRLTQDEIRHRIAEYKYTINLIKSIRMTMNTKIAVEFYKKKIKELEKKLKENKWGI